MASDLALACCEGLKDGQFLRDREAARGLC